MKIDIIVPRPTRLWQKRVVERLQQAGHDVAVFLIPVDPWPAGMRAALAMERRLLHRNGGLGATTNIEATHRDRSPDLRIDLAGVPDTPPPLMRVAFDGNLDDAAVNATLAAGRLPDIEVVLDAKSFERAAPMIDNRIFVTAAADDVFARTVTLLLKAVDRFARGERGAIPFLALSSHPPFSPNYLFGTLPRIAKEVLRRRRFHYAHWRVGYRLHDGPGIAETSAIGSGWSVLPDDGTRFYADPFPFEHEGRSYIFVEDYPHATGKAVISVAALDDNGVAGVPAPALEEPHHLSYPQVFARDGEIWMLPEGSGSGKLTLYRAERFPDRWVPAATLLEGAISDATLFEHDGHLWLFATDRDGGAGSTSDTLVVFKAETLTGPWTPHRNNPILIDRRRARPGGAFIVSRGGPLLPVQDGTLGYGGGLGLSQLVRLDDDVVTFADPKPVLAAGDFPYPQIHTLNRAGRLEVIDGIAAVART